MDRTVKRTRSVRESKGPKTEVRMQSWKGALYPGSTASIELFEVAEVVGSDEQQREQGQVVADMDAEARADRPGPGPDRGQYQADKPEQQQRRPGMRQLTFVNERE